MTTKTPLNQLKGFYNRGYLPHYDGGALWQSLTIRLKGSLPASVIKKFKLQIQQLPEDQRIVAEAKLIEDYLDNNQAGLLKNPSCATIVTNAIMHFDGLMYDLGAFVVMSNHAHLLIKPLNEIPIHQIASILKSRTSRLLDRLLKQKGSLWANDYFDRYIRSSEHWHNVRHYIEDNPVKIRLYTKASDYPFSSAFYRNKIAK